jgi:hypothetical protein
VKFLRADFLNISLFLFAVLFSIGAWASNWPEAPWLNSAPQVNATVSAIAFISPYDLQFYRIMNVWKKLDKKYSSFQVNFIVVTKSEQNLNFDDEKMRELLNEYNYSLPVLLDLKASYSKLWRAYVTPTVNLVLKEGKVISFDPGNFDPATLEKSLQKVLKDSGAANLPSREYTNESEAKSCGHPRTLFLGQKFQKVLSVDPIATQKGWTPKPYFLEKSNGPTATMEILSNKNNIGVLAENIGKNPVRINVSLEGSRIPTELRGKDLVEDKVGTYFLVRSLKMYDVLSHGSHLKEGTQKLTLGTEGKDLEFRAVEIFPSCLENL